MARHGLRIIIMAAVLFGALVLMATVLAAQLRRSSMSPPPAIDISSASEAQLAAAALRVDDQGTGTQVMGGLALTFKLDPPTPKAAAPVTLRLIALNVNNGQLVPVSPTLSIGETGSTTATDFVFQPQADGSYLSRGVFFPGPGKWRMRVMSNHKGLTGFLTLIDIEAR